MNRVLTVPVSRLNAPQNQYTAGESQERLRIFAELTETLRAKEWRGLPIAYARHSWIGWGLFSDANWL